MRGNAKKQRKANKSYYSKKGAGIYSDFSTFAQGHALAKCNAIGFVHGFGKKAGIITVCEYGIGKGDFAKRFLDEVKKLDKRLHARTRYYLFDFSEKMLLSARKNLHAHRFICIFGKFDAVRDKPDLQFDYCRINELLTDLPAELYMQKKGAILDEKGSGIASPSLKEGAIMNSNGKATAGSHLFVSKFLERVDEGRLMPFNFVAQEFLLSLCKAGKPNFRLDLFDYGFYTADDVLLLPAEEWNRLMVRNYGGQLTVDLNFPLLLSSLASDGFSAKIEKQKEYAEKILGIPLRLSETKSGLDYVPAKRGKDGISEDDGFYHLRIGK